MICSKNLFHTALHPLKIAALVTAIGGLCVAGISAEQGVLQKKRVLTEQLDSIDLEKQLRKRKGLSLDELEKASDLLKDSIAEIKKQIVSGEDGVPEQAQSPESGRSSEDGEQAPVGALDFRKFLPKNVFDWIVVAVGGVAIISGIVLVAGLFGLLFRKKKKPQAPLHSMFPQASAGDLPQGIPKVPGAVTELKDERVASIRKRIEQSQQGGPDADDANGDGKPLKPPADAEDTRDALEIKRQVIQAAQQGLDVQEISRRYHLSADQVSLILRISRLGGPKNG